MSAKFVVHAVSFLAVTGLLLSLNATPAGAQSREQAVAECTARYHGLGGREAVGRPALIRACVAEKMKNAKRNK